MMILGCYDYDGDSEEYSLKMMMIMIMMMRWPRVVITKLTEIIAKARGGPFPDQHLHCLHHCHLSHHQVDLEKSSLKYLAHALRSELVPKENIRLCC